MESIETITSKIAAGQVLGLEGFVYTLYRAGGVPDVPAWEAVRIAFQRAEHKHPDLPKFRGEMWSVAMGLTPIWSRMTLDRYIEVLYRAGEEYSRRVREATPMEPVTVQ